MINIALQIEGLVNGKIMYSAVQMDKHFFSPTAYMRDSNHCIEGTNYTFYVMERCTSGLSRSQIIKLCQHVLSVADANGGITKIASITNIQGVD